MDKNLIPIISTHKLAASYRNRVIWREVSFEVLRGEFVGIIGSNGAGKTTLFKLLLGLAKPSDGQLKLFDTIPDKGNPKIGYVPQRRPVDPELNIESLEFVKLGLSGNKWGISFANKNQQDELALNVLSSVDALDLAHRPIGVLSGGEQQKIFLAQALIGEPELLLLDEPLANLDIKHQLNLIQLIYKIVQEKNISVMLITHDLNPLLPVLNKVIYIANGHISCGTPKEVITSKTLSKLYGSPIEVLRDSKGRVAILGVEESAHPHA